MLDKLQKNYDVSSYSGIRVGGKTAGFVEIESAAEVGKIFDYAKLEKLAVVPLGAGSNIFFNSGISNCLVVKNNILGKRVLSEKDEVVRVRVTSGENWDDFVGWSVSQGLAGIEALSAIPGTVGAAPVQNIGAYGQEVSNVIHTVETYDSDSKTIKTLTNAEGNFSYRNSIFKQNPGRYFITAVTFNLTKNTNPGIPDYKVAVDYFAEKQIVSPSLEQIRTAITEIRWSKLPRPEILPNCGSWFKNPIINVYDFKLIESYNPSIPNWSVNNEQVKVAAGWLVEHSVGKDFCDKYFCTYGLNALVIINPSITASSVKLLKFENIITDKVFEKFGITLEREPIFVK